MTKSILSFLFLLSLLGGLVSVGTITTDDDVVVQSTYEEFMQALSERAALADLPEGR